MGYDRTQVLHRLRYLPPASSFRSHAEEKLYVPLGMTSTSSRHADFVAAENRAHGHVRVDGEWVAKYDRHPDVESPAGGVSSSARDMAQWLRLQFGKHGDGSINIMLVARFLLPML
jgi:CubicO group peptidase (beta-lactamase class C family)